MKMRARAPISRAAHATACPWFPALAATTSSASSVEMRLYAPRILNEPVRWRFSAFSFTSRPTSRESVSEAYTGVTRATPSSRARAASISGRPGAVLVVANTEHLLQNLTHRAQRIELSALHLVEQPSQLLIVGYSMLQMGLRARRRDGEYFAGEVLGAPALQLAGLRQEGTVRFDLVPELRDAIPPSRLGEYDRRPPLAVPFSVDTAE